jgi:hypothetical protein
VNASDFEEDFLAPKEPAGEKADGGEGDGEGERGYVGGAV